MLGPLERLKLSGASKKHRVWIYGLAAIIAIEFLSVLYVFPEATIILILASAFASVALCIMSCIVWIANEIAWIFWHKRL